MRTKLGAADMIKSIRDEVLRSKYHTRSRWMAQANTITDGDNNAASPADAICTCYTFDVRFLILPDYVATASLSISRTVSSSSFKRSCWSAAHISYRYRYRNKEDDALRLLTSASVTMGVDCEGEVEMAGAVRAIEPRSTSGDLSAFLRISMPCWISSGVNELPRRSVGGRSASLFTETWPTHTR